MKKNNDFLDNFAKLAESGFVSAVNLKNEISNHIRNQIDSMLNKMDFVRREEFNALKKTCTENQKQIKQLLKQNTNTKKNTTKAPAKKKS